MAENINGGYTDAFKEYYEGCLRFLRGIPSGIRDFPRNIRNFDYQSVAKYLQQAIRKKSMAAVLFASSFILAFVIYFTFEKYRVNGWFYCLALIYSSGITFTVPQGRWFIKKFNQIQLQRQHPVNLEPNHPVEEHAVEEPLQDLNIPFERRADVQEDEN